MKENAPSQLISFDKVPANFFFAPLKMLSAKASSKSQSLENVQANSRPLQVSGHGRLAFHGDGQLLKRTNAIEADFYAHMAANHARFYRRWMCRAQKISFKNQNDAETRGNKAGSVALLLEDAVARLYGDDHTENAPCCRTMMDVKVGTRLHSPLDCAEKVQYKIEKAHGTTTGRLGVRVCGLFRDRGAGIANGEGSERENYNDERANGNLMDKQAIQRVYFSADDHDGHWRRQFVRFFSDHFGVGQLQEMHTQLMELIADYQSDILFNDDGSCMRYPRLGWYSSSLLWVDDFDEGNRQWRGHWCWIDFAQSSCDWSLVVADDKPLNDDGVLLGLRNLEQMIHASLPIHDL